MEKTKLLSNFLLFLTGLFLCILGKGYIALYVTSAILFIHFLFIGNWQKEKEVLAVTLLLGCALDSFLGNLDILQFHDDSRILPMWLACLWALFATTLRHSFNWSRKHRLAGSALGFVAGPAVYYMASILTDVSLAEPLWQTLLTLAIIWALVIPLLQTFSNVWQKKHEGMN